MEEIGSKNMKLTPAKIKKYNKIAEKKPIMVRVDSKWYTWAEGDPKHGVFLTTQDGKDVEFDFNQIDDIKESVTRLTKSKLKEMIKEELLKKQLGEAVDAKKATEIRKKLLKKFVPSFLYLNIQKS